MSTVKYADQKITVKKFHGISNLTISFSMYFNVWATFLLNNRQRLKALKCNHQPSKLEKIYGKASKLPPHWDPNSFPGFSPTRPYGARENLGTRLIETLLKGLSDLLPTQKGKKNWSLPSPPPPCNVVPLFKLPIGNDKHHNFEWRGEGRGVD